MLWAVDMVVQRRDDPRRLRDHDDVEYGVGAKVLDFDRSRVSSTVRAAAAAAPTQADTEKSLLGEPAERNEPSSR